MGILKFIGRAIGKKLVTILEIIDLLIHSLEQFIIRPKERKVLRPIIYKQILFTGYDALRLIGIIALGMGGIVLFLTQSISKTIFFDQALVGVLMSQVILRELAPLIVAIILVGRSGTAVATEIANMKVNNEIEALESLGIDPVHYLVAPRIIGMTFSLVFLTIYFFFIAMLGGYLFSTTFFSVRLPLDEYLKIVFDKMEVADIGFSLLKSLFFGLFISTIACYKGLKVPPSSNFVPVVATQTVVSGMTSVFFFYGYFTILYFL